MNILERRQQSRGDRREQSIIYCWRFQTVIFVNVLHLPSCTELERPLQPRDDQTMLAQPQVGGIWDTESENFVFKDSVAQITQNCEAIASRGKTSLPRRHRLSSPFRRKKRDTFVEDCRVCATSCQTIELL